MFTFKRTLIALLVGLIGTVAIPVQADIISRSLLYGSAALTALVTIQYGVKTYNSYDPHAFILKKSESEKVREIAINRFTHNVFHTLCFGAVTGFFLYKAIKIK